MSLHADPGRTTKPKPLNITPDQITWEVLKSCQATFKKLRRDFGEVGYQETKEALQATLCDYFNSGECDHKRTQISPIGGTPNGGKALKVRWQLPGGGKSGGLRLAVVAYCSERRVKLADAFPRKEDPTDAEFKNAVRTA